MRRAASILGMVLTVGCASEHVRMKTEAVYYEHAGAKLKGFVARPEGEGSRPAVLICHAWRGHDTFVQERAKEIAAMGYVAMALDMYGDGVLARDNTEAKQFAGRFKQDRALMRARSGAGLDAPLKLSGVDGSRVAAIGYCFGGTTALELARSGAALAGVVTFHGGLDTPDAADARNIKARLLILHGADDPVVPPDEVAAFQKEMKDAEVDVQLVIYSGAVHGFTHKGTPAHPPDADRRSWIAMKSFLEELF